jgi:Double zinc ribbon
MPMEQKIYHGQITPTTLAQELISHFNRGNLKVQQVGTEDQLAVQIATAAWTSAGGQTALSVSMQKVEDGVAVEVGEQAWLGVAADLGMTALAALSNPMSLIGRLNSLAQDVEYLTLKDEVWKVLEDTAQALGSGYELSDRLRRYVCTYCNTANPPGESNCIACGAPLGDVQPHTCKWCGYVLLHDEKYCPNCGKQLA